jgi:small ligand-binding sensory domain FIST
MQTRFASSLSTDHDADRAVGEAVEALMAGGSGAESGLDGSTPDLLTLFVSHHYGPALERLGDRLKSATGARVLLGCTGESIIGDRIEVESGPALSLWAGVFPGTSLRPFAVRAEQDEDGVVFSPLPEVRDRSRAGLLLLGDPHSFPMPSYLRHLNERLAGVPAVGGMASGGHGRGQNLLFLDDEVRAEGALGVALEGAVEIQSVVSQGCRPVGDPLVITACQGQRITKLGGRPAAAVLVEMSNHLPELERELLRAQPFLGLAIDARKQTFERGDFLVRGVVGLDTHQSAVLISDHAARRGMTVQFLVRDAESADDDLVQLLHERGGHTPEEAPGSVGALVFSCNGRGSQMFDRPHHDIGCVQDAFRGQLPAAGFFAMGEIGPVGGQNFLHGFTASVALFRERG